MDTATLVKPEEKVYTQKGLTVEEAYGMVCEELKAIYDIKDAASPPSADGRATIWRTPTSGITPTPSTATRLPLLMPATRRICTIKQQ